MSLPVIQRASAEEKQVISGEKLPPEDFLAIVRNPPGRRSWASLEGNVTHRREGARTIKAPLRLGLLFTPEQTIAQLDFNNGEIYNIGQMLGKNAKTVLTKKFPDTFKTQLPLYGIEPQDLAMSFLYWDFLREEKGEWVKGQTCRKFILKEKEKNGKYLLVLISSRYFFPVKAAFYTSDPAKTQSPYKTLEITSFVQKDKFWYPGKLRLEGKNWKSMVSFSKLDADENNKRLPTDLFRK
ncbi:MAG: hypothetical protein IKA79_06170 [Lentisphaeria bacterium]|nr:hypothetical protein [Lentisphaeria bacterium]